MASGVKVSDAVFEKYNQMKLKKLHRYMTMEIQEGFISVKEVIDKAEDQEKDFNAFRENLPSDHCLYILLDLNVTSKSGAANKPVLFLITWCPDSAKTKDKMVYASSKQALLDKIREGTKPLQANDLSDLEYEELLIKGQS